ncbi:MAG: rhomboid family intramembrane serine protease [Bacteroidales bacterium]|nr:rhomboid family intramembrane serine protease [Bacteroidales bacterium]MCB8999742.1 rhomboid family intramembrane serine protease [Bacteroidales bacterium]MCB9013448.1 rhomboid family intramembrane serine protease [Bacteroidales bacterium]
MITIIIVITTVLISFLAFQNPAFMSRYDFSPYRIFKRREYYRFITHAFLHADWIHLFINMLVLFSFGVYVEREFQLLQNEGRIHSGMMSFILLYFSSMIISGISTFISKRNNPYYIAVGASGAVSAVLFTSIFFSPLEKILLYGIIPMPGIVFGVLYLAYSSYMGKKSKDNVNHSAHLWGALYGLLYPLLLDPSLLSRFINQLGF